MSLCIKNLSVYFKRKKILDKIDLEIIKGNISVLMGPNGSGKTTLAMTLMGKKDRLRIEKRELRMDGVDISNSPTDERARRGMFLSFQSPVSIPGITVANLLRISYQAVKGVKKTDKPSHNPALNVWSFNQMLVKKARDLHIAQELLGRDVNENFSGGERKKIEILQAVILRPKYAIFDEIDTGLDIDALQVVGKAIEQLREEGCGVLLITHSFRIIKLFSPEYVHVMINGKIISSGGIKLAREVEKNGYGKWIK